MRRPRGRSIRLGLDDTPHARERLKKTIVSRFSVRVHLFLILTGCFAAALFVTTLLHMLGVEQMHVRYPLALVAAYVAFVAGVRIWLQYAGFGGALNRDVSAGDHRLDVDGGSWGPGGGSTPFSGGGGGSSGGGGASASYDDAPASAGLLSTGESSSKSSTIGGFDIEDGAIVGVALVAVVAVVFGAAVYLVMAAPAILCDAAFAALLSGGLIRSTRRIAEHGWITSVIRHTWVSFGAILAVTMAFTAAAHHFFPQAHTVTELVRLL